MEPLFDSLTDLQLLAYRPKITTYRRDAYTGQSLPPMLDTYMIWRQTTGRYRLENLRTGHNYSIPSSLLIRFEVEKWNHPGGLQNGVLRIRGSLFQSGDHTRVIPMRRRSRAKLHS